jgi:signal peptidase I
MSRETIGRFFLLVALSVLVSSCGGGNDSESQNRRTFTFQNTSMEPAIRKGESVTFDLAAPCCKRGDVVLFTNPPPDSQGPPNVKRIVAKGGDTLVFARDGSLQLNGKPLEEPYLDKATATYPTGGRNVAEGCGEPDGEAGCVVPAGTYYLLGDNRQQSNDSRNWGPVDSRSVFGVLANG